ncbi:MAG: hypothetical protein LC104_21575 [Bacteroidales bacterium]|nr:hypothetical protein [Bacteroidales bacterium]
MFRSCTITPALLLLVLTGCADTNSSLFGGSVNGRPIETPELPQAALDMAARVDQVGRELLAASPFLGVEPIFQTVSMPEPVLFHPNPNIVIISDGLVKRCANDDALAAVLAAELGQMAAERKVANRNELPPLPVNLPDGANLNAGGISSDQTHLAELAMYEKKYRRGGSTGSAVNARELAKDVLRSAGRSDSQLATVEGLVESARANQIRLPGFAAKPKVPQWTP